MGSGNHSLLAIFCLTILLIHDSAAMTAPARSYANSSSCENQSHCGITIPYPFGIGKGCFLDEWYEIICNTSSGKPVPFLKKLNREVLNISLLDQWSPSAAVRIKNPITSFGCSGGAAGTPALNMTGSPFNLARNTSLVAVGCNNRALMTDAKPLIVGCESTCNTSDSTAEQNTTCNGYRCCQLRIPDGFPQVIGVRMESVDPNATEGAGCGVAFLTDETFSLSNITEPEQLHAKGYATVELEWHFDASARLYVNSSECMKGTRGISLSYERTGKGFDYSPCVFFDPDIPGSIYRDYFCNNGYRGNPYLRGGCKEIDACKEAKDRGRDPCGGDTCVNIPGTDSYNCVAKKTWPTILGFSLGFGLLILTIGTWWLLKFVRKRKKINRKKKFFKRNGGLLLQHQLTAAKGNVEKTRIFSSKEIEKATEKFSENRILGEGGQGTVYKGMLIDGKIVAVKKSKLVDEDNLEEFINEVVILSQINHRNVVKLLGCCLETEVPILVYEFIPNGNLFEHLHDQFDDYILTWKVRLYVAIEIAGAVSYLHSAASIPVYHRDIKSTNILLDEKYRAKVSDFGTSRSVTIDNTHLTTIVLGTAGYVDPEYLQSSQFSDKSDVYSFGVVLVELITGEKPLSYLRPQESRTLATHFILAMKENKLFDIIDPRIKDDCEEDEVMAMATLAKRCLNLSRKKRPNMREVSIELERIRASPKDSKVQTQHEEEDEAVEINIGDSWNVAPTTPASEMAIALSTDVEPLVPYQTW